ncbi:MAG: hypothetical protein RLY78_544 [Pseudomonadota bacterium]|jgi:hypothetical protein|uniref:Uncharacterized protein n=1 Tax=Pseudaquabacterium rugosum TaxID=2984194 RepID=A0ABU9BGJ8_9BURK
MTRPFRPASLAVVATALLVAACGSNPLKQTRIEEQPDCVFPQSNAKAPIWVCGQGALDGVAVWEAGSYQKTAAGAAFQQDQATLSGRVRLAQRMKTMVTAGVKAHVATTGSGKSETVDQVASSTANAITAETLVGSRVYRTAYAPDGTMFVLVGLDEGMAKRVVEQAVSTSMNNNRAQWQQVKGAQAQSELAAEVYKLGIQSMQ